MSNAYVMNKLASKGESGDPCGVPLSRATRVPSGICIGAFSHRSMYNKNPSLASVMSYRFEQQIMRDVVEKSANVKI